MRTTLRHIVQLLLVTGFALVVSNVWAQGSISGTITDAQYGDRLIGVNVIVVGTSAGAATDADGVYVISGMTAGAYSVRVSYLGYETKLYTDIRVANGQTTTLDIERDEGSGEGETALGPPRVTASPGGVTGVECPHAACRAGLGAHRLPARHALRARGGA